MYTVSPKTDWVSMHIHNNGTWEEEETREVLGRLEAYAEVRQLDEAARTAVAGPPAAAERASASSLLMPRAPLGCLLLCCGAQEHALPRDQVVLLDIGANLGWFSLQAAAQVRAVHAPA